MQVFADDAARLGSEKTARLVAPPVGYWPATPGRPSEPERFMKMVDGHCAALELLPGGRFSCSVYEERPTICRVFEQGSSSCVEVRARAFPKQVV